MAPPYALTRALPGAMLAQPDPQHPGSAGAASTCVHATQRNG